MANIFEVLVTNLSQLGFFGFLLPWVLMFAISYGLLLKSKAVGEDKKVIGVISLVLAFFVIGLGGAPLGNIFVGIFGTASVVLAAILVIVLFVGMAGGEPAKLMESKNMMVLVAGIGLIILFFVISGLTGVRIDGTVMSVIFMVVIMAVAVWFVAGNGK